MPFHRPWERIRMISWRASGTFLPTQDHLSNVLNIPIRLLLDPYTMICFRSTHMISSLPSKFFFFFWVLGSAIERKPHPLLTYPFSFFHYHEQLRFIWISFFSQYRVKQAAPSAYLRTTKVITCLTESFDIWMRFSKQSSTMYDVSLTSYAPQFLHLCFSKVPSFFATKAWNVSYEC